MAKILLMVSDSGNRRVLAEALPQHELLDCDEDSQPPDDVGLIVVDFNRLRRDRQRLARLRQAQSPTLLPVLLMLRENQLGHTRNVLGEEVDDVVFTPVLTTELLARIRNLNRLRALSKSQHQRYLASESRLQRVDRAYRILAECNEAVIHCTTEEALLDRVLACLVGSRGYLLAWVGLNTGDGGDGVRMKAVRSAGSGLALATKPLNPGSTLTHSAAAGAVQERTFVLRKGAEARDCPIARELGADAALALPLFFDGGDADGVLALYSTVASAFHREEVELLGKLADNLAHGLSALTTRERLEEQRALAQRRAYRDSLTELPNRQYVKEELAKLDSAAERHMRCAALPFLDLDGFKRINDSLGHAVGDRLLKMVAGRLTRIAREEDFVARLGGDEFVFLIQGEVTDVENREQRQQASDDLARAASLLAERLIAGFREPFLDGAHEHRLGVSVGISLFPADTRCASDLINWADMAMYKAKSNGGDQFQFYSPALTINQRQRLELESQLYQAVEQDQLCVHYQPIVNLRTGEVSSVEALMRWQLPDGSLRTPADFLQVLEETGLIARAGESLLRQACQALTRFREIQPGLRLSLNLSMNQLWQPRILEWVQRIVHSEGILAPAIVIEITEDSMLRDCQRMESLLADLKASGFEVAIDDFGTGYSSLSRLKDMPVATLKLDRSFLTELDKGPVGRALMRSVQEMAGALKLNLVAEGIETPAQLATVRQLGYGYGQGFLFAPPLAEEDLTLLLHNHAAGQRFTGFGGEGVGPHRAY